ncbi:putative toxin-antitoxin system toxin component, PIN family [Candidatus Woesearchaeota archaeon]|nr:putative toxin-antitoxin system toxin component, PIN family [Candidatus Woesearchaeota archaeon]
MAVTFDTNVLLSATLWDGSVAQKLLFDLIRQGIKIYSTTEIISEYQEILKRDFDFSDAEVSEIMEKVLTFVTLVSPQTKIKAVKDDPDDDIIIECALESES